MMELLDGTGAWVRNIMVIKAVQLSLYRPWESAVNIDAIRKLTESFNNILRLINGKRF